MPSAVAACLFLGFILWLIVRTQRSFPGVSRALWIPTIWIAINASKPIGYWLNGGEGQRELTTGLDGSPLDRNIFLGLMLVGIFVLSRRRVNWSAVLTKNRWMWIFYIYLLISIAWSGYPFVAFKRYLKELGNVVMILIILTERDPTQAIHQVFIRCVYVLVPMSVLLIKYYPESGRYYNYWTYSTYYSGVTTNKNSLGLLAMLSCLVSLWSVTFFQKPLAWLKRVRRYWPEFGVLAMCLWILSIAGSATSLVCFLVGATALFASRMLRDNPRLLLTLAGGAIMVSVLFLTVPDVRKAVTGKLGRNPDLTERTDIWRGVFKLKSNPLIGEGFASFWLTPGAIRLGEELNVPHAHNGYLETYLNSGLIGVGLLLAVLVCAAKNTLAQVKAGTTVGYLYSAFLISGLIYNYTEATFNNNNVVGFVLFLTATQYRLIKALKAPDPKAVSKKPALSRDKGELPQGAAGAEA